MFEQGLILMGAGMGTVVSFLTIMVIVMYGSSAILRRYDKKPPSKGKPDTGATGRPKTEDLTEIAVAIAAVKSHTAG